MKYKYTVSQLEKMYGCRWLTDNERQVFELYYQRGWAIDDIAAELYCSPGKIKKDLRSIREKTRDCEMPLK